MIDNAALLVFSALIVYTVIRAVKLDKLLPWFSAEDQQQSSPSKKGTRK